MFQFLPRLQGEHVINVGEPSSFHSLNTINTKHQETLQKNKNNYKTKNIKMPPASSKKNQTNFNNRHRQSHITTSSASKTPNKHDSIESNVEKNYLSWNQGSDN